MALSGVVLLGMFGRYHVGFGGGGEELGDKKNSGYEEVNTQGKCLAQGIRSSSIGKQMQEAEHGAKYLQNL